MPSQELSTGRLDLPAGQSFDSSGGATFSAGVVTVGVGATSVVATAASGNLDVGGTLGVDGVATFDTDVNIGTGATAVTVTAASGNVDVGGTLGVDGAATFDTTIAVGGIVTHTGGTNTAASAAVLTPTLSSGSATQLADLTRDYHVAVNVTTSGTATHIEIGPTSTPANTIMASASATAGQVISFRLPAGWYIKFTGTTTVVAVMAISC